MIEESIAIANVIPERAATVILDARGESMSSVAFASRLQDWRNQDKPAVAFIIGAADGLAPTLREQASLAIAFGAATFTTNVITLQVSPGDLVVALLLALVVGLGGGLGPAWRAARLRPIDALRRA